MQKTFAPVEVEVKCNYKSKYSDLKCTFCNSQEDDDQYHLLQCEYSIKNCKNLAENIKVEYEDIFDEIEKQVYCYFQLRNWPVHLNVRYVT